MEAYALRVVSDSMACEASCPHCAYRDGTIHEGRESLDLHQFRKARQFAVQSRAVAMEIEAKGDPLLGEWTGLYQILSEASSDFPQMGLTTPGNAILESQESFLNLVGWHLTNITLTLPHHDPQNRKALLGFDLDYKALIPYLREECRLVVRAACHLSKPGIASPQEALDFVSWCRETGIQQVVFREVEIPDDHLDEQTFQWCRENAVELDGQENWDFDDPAHNLFYLNSLVAQNKARPVFVLPWGETVYEIDGVNVVFEKSEKNYYGQFVKSLVLSANHMYARWESPGTIIF